MARILELTFPDSDELPDRCRAVILLTPSGFNVAIQELDANYGLKRDELLVHPRRCIPVRTCHGSSFTGFRWF